MWAIGEEEVRPVVVVIDGGGATTAANLTLSEIGSVLQAKLRHMKGVDWGLAFQRLMNRAALQVTVWHYFPTGRHTYARMELTELAWYSAQCDRLGLAAHAVQECIRQIEAAERKVPDGAGNGN